MQDYLLVCINLTENRFVYKIIRKLSKLWLRSISYSKVGIRCIILTDESIYSGDGQYRLMVVFVGFFFLDNLSRQINIKYLSSVFIMNR